MLYGCSNNNIKVDFQESTFEAGNSIVNISTPYVECKNNINYSMEVNDELSQIQSMIVDEFTSKANGNNSRLDVNCDMVYNNGSVLALLYECVSQLTNKSVEKFRISVIYDFKNCRKITLNDIFSDFEWKNYVDARMSQMVEDDNQYAELWEVPSTKILKDENFYLKNGNILVVYFPPYELSYYRRGFVEFEFKLDELSGFMSREVKEVIFN